MTGLSPHQFMASNNLLSNCNVRELFNSSAPRAIAREPYFKQSSSALLEPPSLCKKNFDGQFMDL